MKTYSFDYTVKAVVHYSGTVEAKNEREARRLIRKHDGSAYAECTEITDVGTPRITYIEEDEATE